MEKTKQIITRGIAKRFGSFWALKDIDIKLEQGKIYGLLGRNGAGKSTLLNILNHRLRASAGSYTIDGENPIHDHVLRKTYLVSPDDLFPKENKSLHKLFRETSYYFPDFDLAGARADLTRYGISAKQKFNKLSTGNASIVKTIIALRSKANYIFLDEPTLGHDAINREIFYKSVLALFAQEENCIVLSSHLISELAPLVEEVIFIDKGQVLLQETVEDLQARYCLLTGPWQKLLELGQILGRQAVLEGNQVGAVGELIAEIPANGITITDPDIKQGPVDLQRLFVALTARPGLATVVDSALNSEKAEDKERQGK